MNAKPASSPSNYDAKPKEGVKQAPSHAHQTSKRENIVTSSSCINGASGEPAEFISLHRLVQGENIPPAHLMNEAAVLRLSLIHI